LGFEDIMLIFDNSRGIIMTKTSNVELKRPLGVYILAFLFLLAPLGNIMISFAGSGVSNWYQPDIFTAFLKTIPLLDWAWLALLFLTGLLLFKAHKLSWTLAIATLFLVLLINVYRVYYVDTNSVDPQFLKVFSILALLCTTGVLVISFYFRFPYLDRRTEWTSTRQTQDRRKNDRDSSKNRRKS
jgi:hypothetical protein